MATDWPDRTAAGVPTTSLYWALDSWGDTLLAVPQGGTLYEQSGSSTSTAVADAPDEITDMIVTSERQVLAFGCNEEGSGTFNGMCIRGSNIEDYTDWTTSATNNAFEHILEGHGKIVAGRQVGAYVAVWTESALYLGQFVGDPGQTYRFDKVDEGCGLVGRNAVALLDGAAYWLTPDRRFMRWAPGDLPQQIPCPISKEFETNLAGAGAARTVACTVSKFSEVWFHYQDSRGAGDGAGAAADVNRFIAFSTKDGSWFRGKGGCTAMTDNSLITSLAAGEGGSKVVGSQSNDVRLFERGSDALTVFGLPYIQSADMSLDNAQRRVMIRGVIPDFEDQGQNLALTLFTRDRPQSSAATKGPYTLTAATTKKDFRASGIIIAVKIATTDGGSCYFRLGKLLFDVVPLGER